MAGSDGIFLHPRRWRGRLASHLFHLAPGRLGTGLPVVRMMVDVLSQLSQCVGVAPDRRVEPGGVRSYGPASCLGLNQPTHLVAAALAGLPQLAELPHEGPHAPAAFEGRSLLPHLVQGRTVLPKHAAERRSVPGHGPVRSPGLDLLADLQARVPAFRLHGLEAVALPDEGVHRFRKVVPALADQVDPERLVGLVRQVGRSPVPQVALFDR